GTAQWMGRGRGWSAGTRPGPPRRASGCSTASPGECKHLIAEEPLAAPPPSRPGVFLVLAPAAGLITATRRRPDDVLYPELARWYRVRDRSGGILMADADSSAFPPGERSP